VGERDSMAEGGQEMVKVRWHWQDDAQQETVPTRDSAAKEREMAQPRVGK